jgi:chromate transporter
LIILTILSYVYEAIRDNAIVQTLFYGMSIGVAVVILDAVTSMAKAVLSQKKMLPVILMIGAFLATIVLEVHIVLIIALCAAVGIFTTLIAKKAEV